MAKTPKPVLIRADARWKLVVSDCGNYASPTPASPCPKCGAKDVRIAGTGRRPSQDDRAYEADAVALCCREYLGTIRVEVNTLFGVREDEAVLSGRCRISTR